MSEPSRVIRLTVINDLVCPYCYVGHCELLEALTTVAESNLPVDFEIEHRPFQLISSNCLCEKKTVEKRAFYVSQLGAEKWTKMEKSIGLWREEKGINLSFGGVISQTISAHRLSRKAFKIGGQLKQLPMLNAIFKAYAEEEKDIGDLEVLADLAESVGIMSHEEATRFLKSDELEQEVRSLADEARANGISGVPVTIIDGKWAVSGGQRSDVYIQIFKKLATCGNSMTCPNAGATTCPKADGAFGKPLVETIGKPLVEPIDKPVVEPIGKPCVEPISKPIAEPVDKPVVEPIGKPVVETIA